MRFDLADYSRQQIRVTDGAWGTQLQGRGLPPGQPPELWNTERPAEVLAVARRYVEAGSDVIITNSFGANRFVLEAHGAGDRAAELAEAAAGISRKAAGDDVKVFASLGPTGKIVMMGEIAEEALAEAFGEVAAGVARGGADAIVLETFAELAELAIALRAAMEATGLPVIASMTFDSGPDKTATMMGNTPEELAALGGTVQAAAVGGNCGAGPDGYVKITRMLRAATDLPIWVKANAGLPELGPEGESVFPLGPAEFAASVPELIEAGANFIGGCCGTTPDHIRAICAVAK